MHAEDWITRAARTFAVDVDVYGDCAQYNLGGVEESFSRRSLVVKRQLATSQRFYLGQRKGGAKGTTFQCLDVSQSQRVCNVTCTIN